MSRGLMGTLGMVSFALGNAGLGIGVIWLAVALLRKWPVRYPIVSIALGLMLIGLGYALILGAAFRWFAA